MGDSRRFQLFSEVISENFTPDNQIADVAGGKGFLQLALRERGFRNITTWDKRPNRHIGKQHYRHQWFRHDVNVPYSLVTGMHPDEGTDEIIQYCGINRVPFVLCPCCIKPSAVGYWKAHKYSLWVDHLLEMMHNLNMSIQTQYLPMNGRNLVIIGRPKLVLYQ